MIKKVMMYTVICDNCKRDCNDGTEYSCWADPEQAKEVAMDSDWHNTEDGKHYCCDCFNFDDEDNLVINKSREKQTTEYTQVCKRCGSSEVAMCAWVNMNNQEIYQGDSGTTLQWCFGKCQEQTTIIEARDYKSNDEEE